MKMPENSAMSSNVGRHLTAARCEAATVPTSGDWFGDG
jgi:hypothetical protein